MISRGIEISIAGAGEEMVRAYVLVIFIYFFGNHALFVLGTNSPVQRELCREKTL